VFPNCPSFDTRGTGLLGDRSTGRPRLASSLIAIGCPPIGHVFAQSPGRYETVPWDLGHFLDHDNTDSWPFARQGPRRQVGRWQLDLGQARMDQTRTATAREPLQMPLEVVRRWWMSVGYSMRPARHT